MVTVFSDSNSSTSLTPLFSNQVISLFRHFIIIFFTAPKKSSRLCCLLSLFRQIRGCSRVSSWSCNCRIRNCRISTVVSDFEMRAPVDPWRDPFLTWIQCLWKKRLISEHFSLRCLNNFYPFLAVELRMQVSVSIHFGCSEIRILIRLFVGFIYIFFNLLVLLYFV